jgi:putative hydrolase of HD superfamily
MITLNLITKKYSFAINLKNGKKEKVIKMEGIKKVVNFFFELMVLKRIQRAGLRNVGIAQPDSVAEHVMLTAQIAYLLGKIEKVNAERSALIALFHDNGETRIGDVNFITKLYLEHDKAEEKSFLDQIKGLPGEEEIKALYNEWREQKTKEAIVARDADILELVLQAKSHLDQGNKLLNLWIDYWENELKTSSAKEILKMIRRTSIDEWWKEIPKVKEEIKKLKK